MRIFDFVNKNFSVYFIHQTISFNLVKIIYLQVLSTILIYRLERMKIKFNLQKNICMAMCIELNPPIL
jgi:hypothetical protein